MSEIFLNRQLEWEDLWARAYNAGFDNLDDYYDWVDKHPKNKECEGWNGT